MTASAPQSPKQLGTERNAPLHFAGRTEELKQLATYAEYVFTNADPSGIPSFHEHAVRAYRAMTG